MIKNYIKIGMRNLLKHKMFSFINIFGLAVSISVCLLAIMLIKDTYSYDRFHPDSERSYRILTQPVRKAGGNEAYATSPYMLAKTLSENYTQVELWTPLVRGFDADVVANNNRITGKGFYTNASFFEMFGFELLAGDPATVLNEPYTVVLTSELAEKLFKGSDAIGQSLNMPAYDQPFKVSGVLKPFPGKTHIEFDALASLATKLTLDKQEGSNNATTNFLDYYRCYNYIRLKDNAGQPYALASLADIVKTNYADLKYESRDVGYQFKLQALNDITPGPFLSNNMGRALPVQVLWFLSALCIIVILSACFNYTNLTIARSLTRAKEVGVRKVMGASRWQVFAQFISEAILLAGFSLLLAYILLQLTIPAFKSIRTLSDMDITLGMDALTIFLFIAFTLVVGLLAGLLPGAVLSRLNPLSVIQKLTNIKMFRKMGLRKSLVVGQFSVSLIFILLLTIILKQVDFAISENFGSTRSDVVNIEMQGHSYEKLVAAFSQLPMVDNISATSHLMGTWRDGSSDVRISRDDEAVAVRDYAIDHNYIDNFNIQLIAGQDFPENLAQQQEAFAIVNENFLRQFQLGDPKEAVGKTIILGDSTQLAIRGVTNDFLFKPLAYAIEPLLLRYLPEEVNVLNLSVSSSDLPGTVAALERVWKQVDKEQDMVYSFYDETAAETYADITDMSKIVAYFGLLGLIIACLGLLGMAIYSVETKAKEISIRKIIGASAGDLIAQLSKGYFWLLFLSVLVAVPVSYFLGKQLLESFAFSIPLNHLVFLPGILLLFGMGLLTIGSQTVRAAFANPVDSLKNE